MAKARPAKIDRKTRAEVMDQIRMEMTAASIEEREPVWGKVLRKYPAINGSTFYRWVNMVVNGVDFARNHRKAAAVQISAEVSKHLPAPVPPGFFIRNANALQMIDSAEELLKTLKHRDMLYRYATRAGVDGAEDEVKRPQAFGMMIRTTLDVVEKVEKLKSEIWNNQRLERIYALIVSILFEEIGAGADEEDLRRRIIMRFREADAFFLLTPHAPV